MDNSAHKYNYFETLSHFTLWLSILTSFAFSTPANWSRIFMSRNFHPCKLVPQIHISQFQWPLSGDNLGPVVHTHVPLFTKQYKLVPRPKVGDDMRLGR